MVLLRSYRLQCLALATVAGLACGDIPTTGPEPLGPGLTVSGILELAGGTPVDSAAIWLRIFDSTWGGPWSQVTVPTVGSGRFAAELLLDTTLTSGKLQIWAQPPLGSGIGRAYRARDLVFDSMGRAEAVGLSIQVQQLTPPVPHGPIAALDPALLLGRYSGETVPPETHSGRAYLDLEITSASDSIFGRYDIDFSATAACGGGDGTLTATITADTLHILLVSDSFPGWGGIPLVTRFLATTYSVGADTLILRYPDDAGDCTWGIPAPLRLIRE